MTANPYDPPKGALSDPPVSGSIEGAAHVRWACRLIWLSVVISIVQDSFRIIHLPSAGRAIDAVIGVIVGLTLMIWVTMKLRAVRNWMRVIFTIFSLLWLVMTVSAWALVPRSPLDKILGSPLRLALLVVQVLLMVVPLVLLNTSQARARFESTSRRERR